MFQEVRRTGRGRGGLFDRIGAFLDARGLEPDPANYRLAHAALTDPDGPVAAALNPLIHGDAQPGDADLAALGKTIDTPPPTATAPWRSTAPPTASTRPAALSPASSQPALLPPAALDAVALDTVAPDAMPLIAIPIAPASSGSTPRNAAPGGPAPLSPAMPKPADESSCNDVISNNATSLGGVTFEDMTLAADPGPSDSPITAMVPTQVEYGLHGDVTPVDATPCVAATGPGAVVVTHRHAQADDPASPSACPIPATATPGSDAVAARFDRVAAAMVARVRDAERRLAAAVRETDALRHKLVEARDTARRDALTGLPNRLAFDEAFAARAIMPAPHALALLDIDHFKRLNDRHGHAVGDRVLHALARTLVAECGGQLVARYGGEEFAVLMSGLDLAAAAALIDRGRRAVAAMQLRTRDTDCAIGRISFSAGCTLMMPGENKARIFERADRLLYRAKRRGRDRVCAG